MQTPSPKNRLMKIQEKVSYLAGSRTTKQLSNPYLNCDHCGGPHEVEEYRGETTTERAYLSSHDILDDPSLLTFYQNDDFTPWGNLVRKEEGEKGPDFKIRSTFEDDLGHFTHEKGLKLKGLEELITEKQNDMEKWFQELNATLDGRNKPQVSQKDPMLAITTRAGTTTKDALYPNQHPIVVEPNIPHREEGDVSDETPEQPPQMTPSPLAPPNQHVKVPFPSRLKNQKIENDNKRFLSYLKDSVVTIPLLDACYHMPKYSTYFKRLLANRKRLEGLVTLGEECSVVTQRGLPKKVDDLGSFTLPCSIGSLSVKNALADLGASINLMPYSMFLKLGYSGLNKTRMNIQLADRSVKYPLGICENVLVKIGNFKFLVDFVILEMEEDNLVPIIVGRPFLATAHAVIDIHDGKLTLRVGTDSLTFDIKDTMDLFL